MTTSMLNTTVTNFELPATSGTNFKLSNYLGKTLVIYFYPKDNTPGCTTQGMQFRDNYAAFQALNTEIFGISRDSLKSHENFKAKFSFPFELLADTEELALTLNGKKSKLKYEDFLAAYKLSNLSQKLLDKTLENFYYCRYEMLEVVHKSFLADDLKNDFEVLLLDKYKRLGM